MNLSHGKKKNKLDISKMYDTKVQTYKLSKASHNDWEYYCEYINEKSWAEVKGDINGVEEKVKALCDLTD